MSDWAGTTTLPDDSDLSGYVTLAEFESYFSDDPRSAAIALMLLSDDAKTWYILRATKNIDTLPLIGYKSTSSQSLQFPRKFILDPEQDSPWGITLSIDAYGYHYESSVSDLVKNACCEEALALYSLYSSSSAVNESDLQQKGIQSFSLGKLSMTFAAGSASKYGSMKSKDAYDILSNAGYIENAPLIV